MPSRRSCVLGSRIEAAFIAAAGTVLWLVLVWRWVGGIGAVVGLALNLFFEYLERRLSRQPLGPGPGRRPVCARCGGDMTGREQGRTCPDCGAMYGIEYVEEALVSAA